MTKMLNFSSSWLIVILFWKLILVHLVPAMKAIAMAKKRPESQPGGPHLGGPNHSLAAQINGLKPKSLPQGSNLNLET